MRFVDTNVLLYTVSGDPSEVTKANVAADVLDRADLCLSVQVLQEFFVQATHPGRSGALTAKDALALMGTWLRYPVLEITVDLMRSAATSSQRWHISYWDAAIVEAARMLGCSQLLTEDLNHGQNFGGVRVVNPFLV